jgi:very-short-patch-repair endonuclease
VNTRPRQLRKTASVAENRLWYVLRNRGLGHKFIRQMQVGPYIADFACREIGLVIELDGGQHATSTTDADRTAYLNCQGYSVLRFWNNEVLENRDGVLAAILSVIEHSPSPDLRFAPATLSPTGRGIRGARAAASSQRVAFARSIPLPIGERSPRSGGCGGMPVQPKSLGQDT